MIWVFMHRPCLLLLCFWYRNIWMVLPPFTTLTFPNLFNMKIRWIEWRFLLKYIIYRQSNTIPRWFHCFSLSLLHFYIYVHSFGLIKCTIPTKCQKLHFSVILAFTTVISYGAADKYDFYTEISNNTLANTKCRSSKYLLSFYILLRWDYKPNKKYFYFHYYFY